MDASESCPECGEPLAGAGKCETCGWKTVATVVAECIAWDGSAIRENIKSLAESREHYRAKCAEHDRLFDEIYTLADKITDKLETLEG
jgi:hypothetical protein